MKLIKDCRLRVKGRCKKLSHGCCFYPNAPLSICANVGIVSKPSTTKTGKEKK